MRAQLYLYDSLRQSFKDSIRLFIETYSTRIAPVFDNIDEEAREAAQKYYEEMGTFFNPDYHDPGDFAEQAWERGYDYYDGLSLMQYNTRLMWVATLYQFWEQQVRKFLYEEITRTHTIPDKHGNETPYEKFCTKGIDDIKEYFLYFNQDLEMLDAWESLNELRLVANVIKHGPGWSATELQKLRPDFFVSEITNVNLIELYKNTLNDRVLNIKDKDFIRYGEALIQFWDELPERLYSKE